MTPFDKFLEFLIGSWRIDIAIVGKLAVLLLLAIYIVFSLVVVKQVKLMNKAIHGLMNRPLLIMAWALVVLAVAVFILSVIIL
jgi:hypothetical protein